MLAIVLTCAFAIVACNDSMEPVAPTEQPLTIGTIHPLRALSGREVLFSITVQNTTDRSVRLQLAGDTAHYDVCLTTRAGSTRVCAVNTPPTAPSSVAVTLPPGASLIRNVRWILRDNSGQPLAPGTYLVTGFLYGLVDGRDTNGSGEDRIESTPTEIEVVDVGSS